MKKFNGDFSLRETLQIIIPGIYFIGLLNPIFLKLDFFSFSNSSDSIELITSGVFSLIVGMMIYALDLPKRLWFFEKNLPTTLITKNLAHLQNVHNKYFDFYDNKIADKQKDITEKYTSIYHFSVNLGLASFILTLAYLLVYGKTFLDSYGLITLVTLILCILLTFQIFYGKKKIRYMFSRQYQKFVSSLDES